MLRALSLSPDAVFHNASGMITMADPIRLDRELTALAMKDGRIIAMGPDAAMHRWRRARRSSTCRAPW